MKALAAAALLVTAAVGTAVVGAAPVVPAYADGAGSSSGGVIESNAQQANKVYVWRARGCTGPWASIYMQDADLRNNFFTDGTSVYNRISGFANENDYYLAVYDGLNYQGDSDYFPRRYTACDIYTWDNRISSLKLL
ncbi:hypothetical protein [Nonomuraea sp. KM88]|uniref:hypothetical protein n=1 Tax=Nonomuraea sp. KM88 TaxID=3457427 RepID=UPI003FCD0FD3